MINNDLLMDNNESLMNYDFSSTFTNISIFAVSLTTKTLNRILTHIYELNMITSAKMTKWWLVFVFL